MFLTITQPSILENLKTFPTGIWPIKVDGKLALIVKVTKESILAAELNKGFSFYLAPVEDASMRTVGLISAYFDVPDEPLTLSTPLFDDELSMGIIETMRASFFKFTFLIRMTESF